LSCAATLSFGERVVAAQEKGRVATHGEDNLAIKELLRKGGTKLRKVASRDKR